MPAYFDTGFSVRQPMWHGLGLVADEYPEDWTSARKMAGLTWEPLTVPGYNVIPAEEVAVFAATRETTVPELLGSLPEGWELLDGGRLLVPAADRQGIVRSDSFASLGNASDQFSLIYHYTMGEIIEALVGEGAKFETAGSCRGGRQVWALAYLDEPFTVPGDETEHLPFLALLNNHDGSGACRVTMTQVRVVCWNTLQMALAEGKRSGREFVFRHAGDVLGRVEEAKRALSGLRDETAEYLAMAEELSAIRIDDERVSMFLTEFLPSPRENGEVCSDRVHENVEHARALFRSIYNASVTLDGIRGTGFGLLNASTEYLDHVRDYRTTDSYLGRSILRAEPAKAKALTLVRGMA